MFLFPIASQLPLLKLVIKRRFALLTVAVFPRMFGKERFYILEVFLLVPFPEAQTSAHGHNLLYLRFPFQKDIRGTLPCVREGRRGIIQSAATLCGLVENLPF